MIHLPPFFNSMFRSIPRLILCLTAALFFTLCLGSSNCFAHNIYESGGLYGTWQRDEKGWWFQNNGNPAYAYGRWGEYREHSYYFDIEGYVVTGWQYIDKYWYYFNPQEGTTQGAMMSGWLYDPSYDSWFYFNQNGIMVTGWHKIDGYWYYFNPDTSKPLGRMAVNEVIDQAYVDSNGRMNELSD